MKWIKVEDKLPDNGTNVLVHTYDGEIVSASVDRRSDTIIYLWLTGASGCPALPWNIATHWTPWPKGPKEDD